MLRLISGLAALGLACAVAFAQDTKAAGRDHVVVNEEALAWGDALPGLPAGAKMAILAGDPDRAGLFTVRLKIPSGYRILPHWHPTDEVMTVIAGSVAVGMGERFDLAKGQILRKGGFAFLPTEQRHYMWATDAAIVQVTSTGPFAIHYVNPSDDPRFGPKD
jgi:hypothetical protein